MVTAWLVQPSRSRNIHRSTNIFVVYMYSPSAVILQAFDKRNTGVGFGVGAGVGLGVGTGVGKGEGAGVGRGLGSGVGPGVGGIGVSGGGHLVSHECRCG
eukprot:gene2959-biopygen7113